MSIEDFVSLVLIISAVIVGVILLFESKGDE